MVPANCMDEQTVGSKIPECKISGQGTYQGDLPASYLQDLHASAFTLCQKLGFSKVF